MFGFGSKKRTTKIVSAVAEEVPDCSTQSVQSTDVQSSDTLKSGDKEELKGRLQALHCALADEACNRVRTLCTEPGWTLWEDKHSTVTEKKDLEPGRTAGRATHRWTSSDYGINEIEEFLWDNEAKSQYDEFSAAMIVMLQYEGDYHIVDQVFKGRFGISGRDFVVVVHKRREDDETHERLTIGVQSIPMEHEEEVEMLMDKDVSEEYWKFKAKVVRGFAFAAGYHVTKNKATNEIALTYVNDADVKSKGVPQWIVTRVKIDQLKIVKNIPQCIETFMIKKNAEEGNATQ